MIETTVTLGPESTWRPGMTYDALVAAMDPAVRMPGVIDAWTMPTAWVYVDVVGRDIGSYVRDARTMVNDMVKLRPGYSIVWSGQYEYMQRAKGKMQLVIPATLAIIFLLLYFNFKSVGETMIVMLSLPFALVGGIWFVWALGYNWSAAVAIGIIALAGVAAETGVVMLIHLVAVEGARAARN